MGGKPANGIISYVCLSKKKREQLAAPAGIDAGGFDLRDLALELGQALHQAALAPGSIVLVDGAFFSSLIQCADCLSGCFSRVFRVITLNGQAGFLYIRAGAPSVNTVTLATLLVLLIALDL